MSILIAIPVAIMLFVVIILVLTHDPDGTGR